LTCGRSRKCNFSIQFNFAFSLEHSDGISIDKDLAAHCHQFAADQGHVCAMMFNHGIDKTLIAHYFTLWLIKGIQ
jgi:hypothetical protein